jgi:hypothetical protein
MATSDVIEIARQEGTEFRSVRLALEDDGAIKMDAQDIGPTVTLRVPYSGSGSHIPDSIFY